MPHLIELSGPIGLNDLHKWGAPEGAEVIFEVKHEAEFQLLAEGVALGILRTLQKTAKSISTLLHTKSRITFGEVPSTPILYSIFGLELIWVSGQVTTKNDTTTNVRSFLGNALYQNQLENSGVFESAGNVSFVVRDGTKLPRALGGQVTERQFPDPSTFTSKVAPHLSSLRKRVDRADLAGISGAEQVLLEWLFHNAENAFEHGSASPPRSPNVIRGFSGLSLKRIWFDSKRPLDTHWALPDFVRDFFLGLQNENRLQWSGIGLCATVTDIGIGIPNTLRHLFDGKTDLEILQKSFADGVTSKRHNATERPGYGLGDMAQAARILKGFLFISSGGTSVFHDFSDEDSKASRTEVPKLNPLDGFNKTDGTTASFLWPSNWIHDQADLPGIR